MEGSLIGAVADACRVSVDTIRHYESKGVITGVARDSSGYRRYGPGVIDRVRIVRKALAIGFTLDELARIFLQRAAGQPPCKHVHQLAVRKLSELDERIETLVELRRLLAASVDGWESRLRDTPDGQAAQLLDSLIAE